MTPTPVPETSLAADPERAPVVDIRGLWSVFHKAGVDTVVHKDLNLTVHQGEFLSIVGGSGSGKTVLLRQILGLQTPSRGTATVLGKPAAVLGAKGAASRVGMLFQHGALYSAFTVLENIAFALRELQVFPDALINEVALVKLQMVGLGPEHAYKMPADLSGGMIKRVALARALAMDPPLLLLDEPTAGLDPNGSDEFCALLRSLHEELGLTVVMVTHDLDTLFALSTRVAVLAEKQVIVSGPPHEVTRFKHPFIQHFFLGERGRRATATLPADAAAAVPASLSPPSPTAPPSVARKDS